MSKEERIAAERERLNKLFADLDANQLQAAAGLISSAAFLAVSLEDLEAEINANGYIDIRDATAVQRHLAMFITLDQRQLAAADFNGDSKIDVDDATDIQKYIAHII